MEKNIAVIWGDCSSPEIVKQTIRVLDIIFHHRILRHFP